MIEFLLENQLNLLSYAILAFSLLSFWISPNKKISIIIFCASILLGLFSKNIQIISLLSIAALGFLIYLFYKKDFHPAIQTLLFSSIFIITILLFIHKIPGYNNWEVFKEIQLSETSEKFSFWLNFDKPIVAFFLLLFAYNPIPKANQYKAIFVQTLPFLVVLVAILSLFATLLHYIVLDPKLPSGVITTLWVTKMLCFTVIIEELFFRFFVQNSCIAAFKKFKYGTALGLVLSSLLFASIHFSGGLNFVILAFISGLIYGGVYLKTKHLESAILLHFSINAVHFFFFSYPQYLQPVIS